MVDFYQISLFSGRRAIQGPFRQVATTLILTSYAIPTHIVYTLVPFLAFYDNGIIVRTGTSGTALVSSQFTVIPRLFQIQSCLSLHNVWKQSLYLF